MEKLASSLGRRLPVHLGEMTTLPDGRWIALYYLAEHLNKRAPLPIVVKDITSLAAIAAHNPRFHRIEQNPAQICHADLLRPVLLMEKQDDPEHLWLLDGYQRLSFALRTPDALQCLACIVVAGDQIEHFLVSGSEGSQSRFLGRMTDLMAAPTSEDLITTHYARKRTEYGIGPAVPPTLVGAYAPGVLSAEKPYQIVMTTEVSASGRPTTNAQKDTVQIEIEKAIALLFFLLGKELALSNMQSFISKVKGPPFDIEGCDGLGYPACQIRGLPHSNTILAHIRENREAWRHLSTDRLFVGPDAQGDLFARTVDWLNHLGAANRRAQEYFSAVRDLDRKAKRVKDFGHDDLVEPLFGAEMPDRVKTMRILAMLTGMNPTFLWADLVKFAAPMMWLGLAMADARGGTAEVTSTMAECYLHHRLLECVGERNDYSAAWHFTDAVISATDKNAAADRAAAECLVVDIWAS